jgi:RNA polymerase sigma-70 factor (family 1)
MQGSEDAFGKLFQRYWERLYTTASRKLADPELAKEIVHDVFLDIWRRRETLAISNVPAYLGKALHYRIINEIVKKKDTFFFDVLENPGASLYAADQALLEKDFTALLSSWLEALPERRREIFVRYYFQHLSAREIAEQLNLSTKTVQNQLSLAVQFLRGRFGHLLPLLLLVQEITFKKN